MLQSIQNDLLQTIKERVQVVIISANGPVFSSGHDLKELVSKITNVHGARAMQ